MNMNTLHLLSTTLEREACCEYVLLTNNHTSSTAAPSPPHAIPTQQHTKHISISTTLSLILHNETNLSQLRHTFLRQHSRTLPTHQTLILSTSTFHPFVKAIGFLLLWGNGCATFFGINGRWDIVMLILTTEFDKILKVFFPAD